MSPGSRLALAVLLPAAVTAAGCGAPPPPAAPDPAVLAERYRAELLAADREFAAAARERDVDRWSSYFADDGIQVPRRHGIVVGPAAIRSFMRPAFADSSTMLLWDPDKAEVSKSGDLGFTTGQARVVRFDAAGKEAVAYRMKYATVWKRQNGVWKVALDIASED